MGAMGLNSGGQQSPDRTQNDSNNRWASRPK